MPMAHPKEQTSTDRLQGQVHQLSTTTTKTI